MQLHTSDNSSFFCFLETPELFSQLLYALSSYTLVSEKKMVKKKLANLISKNRPPARPGQQTEPEPLQQQPGPPLDQSSPPATALLQPKTEPEGQESMYTHCIHIPYV